MVKAIARAAVVLIIALCGTLPTLAAPPEKFDSQPYVDRAIELARENALTADKVVWDEVTAGMTWRAAVAEDSFDLYPALVYLLDQLRDGHSFLQLNSEIRAAYELAKGKPFEAHPEQKGKSDERFSSRRAISSTDVSMRQMGARVIVVPSFSGDENAIDAFAAKLYQAVVAKPAACGFIIDFRGNGGGNMWPMLAGLTPLLENGNLGYFVNKEGRSAVFHRNGQVGLRSPNEESIFASISEWAARPELVGAPVAVLIVVPIMLAERPNTRFFGAPTHGASTSTEGFMMPDGANLVIATSGVTDRAGKLYESGLKPDEHVESSSTDDEDPPLQAALSRLMTPAACAPA